jgi:16S rRNA processing protein RimM
MTEDHDQRASQKNPRNSGTSIHSMSSGAVSPSGGAWAAVGEIVGAFGIHGEVKVRPLTDFAGRFAIGATLYLGEGREPRSITSSRAQGTLYIIGLHGCATINDAERLRGKELAIPDAELAPLPADQFYQHDILGLRVERMDGRALGVITDIVNGGASDLYIVRDQAGQEHMLPAVREFVHDVDLAARVMHVTPIPGLFDDEADEAG